jgi:hypothetical protein
VLGAASGPVREHTHGLIHAVQLSRVCMLGIV